MSILSLSKRPNIDAAIVNLLTFLKVGTDPKTVMDELDKHPDYPSLLAVSDVLTFLGIENSAFRLSYDDLPNVNCPFLAHAHSHGGELMVVNKMDDENIYLSTENWNQHKLSNDEFKKIFSGVVLTAERSENNIAPETAPFSLSNIRTPAVAAGIFLALVLAIVYHSEYISNLSWQLAALTLFKSVGFITSILLLVQSIDSNNPLVQVLCQSKGKSHCNAILSSKAAKLTDWLSWSEVGFFYFAGTWLLLLFGGGSTAVWQALVVLNLVSLPYTFYSIYYQARVAKQWCVLCCTVQALLWLEFVPLISRSTLSIGEGWSGAWSTVFICMVIPVVLWTMLKPLFLKLQQLTPLKNQLRKFKYNTELFNAMLAEQPKYALPDESWSIVLGSAESNNVITMVTNPYCPPCSKMHVMLDELLGQREDVQARIVFTADNTDADIKTPVSRHLMALNELADKSIVRMALHDWYEQKQKSYEAWAKIYPVELKETEYYKIDRQFTWCEMAEVTATPTLLLNGYRLPNLYQLPDLKYMLE